MPATGNYDGLQKESKTLGIKMDLFLQTKQLPAMTQQ